MNTRISIQDGKFVLIINGIIYGRFDTYAEAEEYKGDMKNVLKRGGAA